MQNLWNLENFNCVLKKNLYYMGKLFNYKWIWKLIARKNNVHKEKFSNIKLFFLFKDKSKRLFFIFLDISAFSALMSEEM